MTDTLKMAREALPARWYCVSREGMATLCVDEDDARANAAENDLAWPRNAPHRAVMLGEVSAAIDAQQAAPVGAPTDTELSPVTVEQARTALDDLDDYARMRVGVDAMGPRRTLEKFIGQVATPPAVQAQDAARYQRLRLMARYDDSTQTVTFPGLRLGAGSGLPDMLDAGLDGAAAQGGEKHV